MVTNYLKKIRKDEAEYLRNTGKGYLVKDNSNSRWHKYRVVEDPIALSALKQYRNSIKVSK